MSGDLAKKEVETGDKPTTSHGKASSEESRNKGKGKEKKPSSHKSHRSGDKKKKMRKVVYYETEPPMFDGEDYARWSDLMRFHLTSLHKSIWDVVEFGVQVPSVGDEDYDEDEVAQIEHFNSQATTIILASLS
jgi:hypothetical protein